MGGLFLISLVLVALVAGYILFSAYMGVDDESSDD